MKAAIFAYSRQGCKTAVKVKNMLQQICTDPDGSPEISMFTMEKFCEDGFAPIKNSDKDFYGELFAVSDAMIFVGACGIAVRNIAPFVRDKRTDPAVICIDELAQFVIPVLSGHIGGANDLAAELADLLGSTAVITTATDINHRFSVDSWARKHHFLISDMKMAKAVSAGILENDIPLMCMLPMGPSPLPQGLVHGCTGKTGILISYYKEEPFDSTLRLIPPVLHLGLGCRKGVTAEAISRVVDQMLEGSKIDRQAIKCAASIDIKSEEPGLLQYCRANNWPVHFYSAQELLEAEGDFTPSEFVRSITGVDNVCERSAMMGADRLIVKKTAMDGVTAAIAEEYLEVDFG